VALILFFTVYVIEVYLIKCPARGIPDTRRFYPTPTPPVLSDASLSSSASQAIPFIKNFTDPPNFNSPRERFKRSPSSQFSIFSFNPTSKPKHKKTNRGGSPPQTPKPTKGNSPFPEVGLRSFPNPRSKIPVASNDGFSESETDTESSDSDTNADQGLCLFLKY
jgi:hypothetical protein